MVGFSYGGGIQLTVAAQDCRVDALVPGLAWHSLESSLYKADTVKTGWSKILVDAAAGGSLDPHILSASTSGQADGVISDEDQEWFASRGPGDAVDAVTVPTLLVQGTVDTLFTLDEALTVHASLVERDVPAKMLWFCGGHGACLTDEGDPERVAEASFAWLDRWVKGDASVDTGPAFDLVDQDGTRWTGDAVPTEDGTVTGALDTPRELELVAEGGSGPSTAVPTDPDDILAGLVAGITPAPATNAVEVPVVVDDGADGRLAVGAPRLRITYAGTVPDGPRPTRLFAQLVDEARGVVVGNQVTPIAVTLDGATHTAEVDLEVVAQRLAAGDGLVLQIVAVTTAYGTPRLGGRVTVSAAEVEVPLAAGLTEG
jgi:ABC-2 type transport system ATP-binding protein